MQAGKSRAQRIRTAVQISIFLLIALLALSKWMVEIGVVIPLLPEISLHAVCPFGGAVTIYEFIAAGQFLPKLHSAAFILMALGPVVALFFGPLFCGYACPLGSYQEWSRKLGRKPEADVGPSESQQVQYDPVDIRSSYTCLEITNP